MADRGRPRTLHALHYAGLAAGLLALTVYGSIIPLRYEPMAYEEAMAAYRDASLFDSTLVWARGDWVVNAVQYGFLAFCVAGALSVDLRWPFRVGAAAVVVPLGFLAASWIEFLQVYFPPRTVSVNDIIVERAGVIGGAVAWVLVGQPLTNWARRFWEMKGLTGLARQALPLYLAVLVVASLMPFDFVLGAEELSEKGRLGRIEGKPFARVGSGGLRAWVDVARNMLVFAPLGVLSAFLSKRTVSSWPVMLGLALGVTVGIEVLQLFVYTRSSDVTDVVTGALAVMIGWWVSASLRDRRAADRLGGGALHLGWHAGRAALLRGRALPKLAWGLALAWVVALVAVSWQPYSFSADPSRFLESDADLSDEGTRVVGLRRMNWAPFVDYYWGSRYNALDQFATRTLSFAPIGVALAVAFGRDERRGKVAVLLLALATALTIEAGQYFIPERHPGTTDLMIQVFGAWFGYRIARHVVHAIGPDREPVGEARYRYGTETAAGTAATTRPTPGRHGSGLGAVSAGLRTVGGRVGRLAVGPSGPLSGLGDAVVRWFDPLPYPAKLAVMGTAAALVSVVLVLVAGRIGLL